MSKATKMAKHHARNIPKARADRLKGFGLPYRKRSKLTPNPAFKNPPFDLADAVFDQTLMEIMRTTGMRDALKKIIMGGGSVTVETGGAESPDPQAVQGVGFVSEGAD
jgi:hypothetical protein